MLPIIISKKYILKKLFLLGFLFTAAFAKAQKIDSIYINLYTDSLKKGTYNYINVDGLLSNGRYMPLDSSDIHFTASAGVFHGNSLWIDPNFTEDKISIGVVLKSNPAQHKEFVMYIKRKPDNERLRTAEEIMRGRN